MIVFVFYDITNDQIRKKVAKYCQQAGLHRIQYSVFAGELSTNQHDTLSLKIDAEIEEDDKVYLIPTSHKEIKKSVFLGQAIDERLLTNELHALLF